MKKDLKRAALAAIIGALAVMTGCEQTDNSNMKGRGTNGKNGTMEQRMDQSKPMPNGNQKQKNDWGHPSNGGSSYGGNGGNGGNDINGGNGGNGGKKPNGSQYHNYCD